MLVALLLSGDPCWDDAQVQPFSSVGIRRWYVSIQVEGAKGIYRRDGSPRFDRYYSALPCID